MAIPYSLTLTDRFMENWGQFGDYTLDQVTWEVNVAPVLKWTIPDTNPRCADVELWRHEVLLKINGVSRFIGEVHQCNTDASSGGIKHQFTAEGLLSCFADRMVVFNGLYFDTLTEQFDIAWALVNYAQQEPAWFAADTAYNIAWDNPSDLRIVRGPALPSGVTRAREYLWYDAKSIMSYLQEFDAMKLLHGFDFSFDYDDASGQRRFNMYYPWKMQDFSGIRYETGKQIKSYKITETTAGAGTDIIYKGGTAGTVHFFGEYIDKNADVYFGHHQVVLTSQYLDAAWLNNQSQRESRFRREPIITPDFDVTVSDDIILTHNEGDLINLVIRDRRHNIAAIYRITKMVWKVAQRVVTLSVTPFTSMYPVEGDFVLP
jgi:hypothetical protein